MNYDEFIRAYVDTYCKQPEKYPRQLLGNRNIRDSLASEGSCVLLHWSHNRVRRASIKAMVIAG